MAKIDKYINNEQAHDIMIEMSDTHQWVNLTNLYTLAAVVQHGALSGVYAPCVNYNIAIKTMAEHGDSVIDFLDEFSMNYGDEISLEDTTWGEICVQFLSAAIDTLCSQIATRIFEEVDL